MKLKELNEQIAKVCGMTPKAVAGVHAETFRLIAEALDKGERVAVADFGIFSVKDVAGEEGQPGKKMIRFRQRGSDEAAGEEDAAKEGGKEAGKERRKRAKKEAAEASGEAAPAEAGE